MAIVTMPNDDHSRLARIGAIGEDMPMTLKEACTVVFKDAISPATLKAEAARGNLVIRKIGRAYFVTWRDLNAMWEKCRQQAPSRAASGESTSNWPEGERSRAALAAALRLSAEKRKAAGKKTRQAFIHRKT